MNETKIFTGQEAKEYADSVSNTLVTRTYEERKATKKEKEIISNIIYGALLAIKWHNFDKNAVQIAKDTAEFTVDTMIPNINGYKSVYLKIDNFVRIYHK